MKTEDNDFFANRLETLSSFAAHHLCAITEGLEYIANIHNNNNNENQICNFDLLYIFILHK